MTNITQANREMIIAAQVAKADRLVAMLNSAANKKPSSNFKVDEYSRHSITHWPTSNVYRVKLMDDAGNAFFSTKIPCNKAEDEDHALELAYLQLECECAASKSWATLWDKNNIPEHTSRY